MLVTFGQEMNEWPRVATLRVEAAGGASARVLFDGPVESASIDLGETDPDASLTLVGEARDAGGALIARGRTATFTGGELSAATVPLLLSPIGGSSRASAGLLGGRARDTSGAALLLSGRYALLANASADGGGEELYDAGLLATLVGGPIWPRAPRTFLRAAGHDVLVLDELGASFVDVFASATPVTTALSADDAAALVHGQVLEGARTSEAPDTPTGRWLTGPCRRGRAGLVASDRVLFVSATDELVVARLSTPRLGATCVVSPGGALVVVGGGGLASIDPLGAVTELPFADDRAFGAGLFADDGALLLIGGVTADGTVAPPVRVAFPCGASCLAVPVDIGALGQDAALLDLEALPTTRGRAFFLGVTPTRARFFHGAATPIGTTFGEITTRRPRHAPDAFVLAGERLLVAGGRDAAGGADPNAFVLDVEVLTPP